MAFQIRIPTGKGKGGASGAAAVAGGAGEGAASVIEKMFKKQEKQVSKNTKVQEDNSREVSDMTAAVTAGNLLSKGILAVFSDVLKLFQPLIRLISLLVFVAFLPLLPLIVELTKKLADFVGKVAKAGGGLGGVAESLTTGDSSMKALLKGVAIIILGVVLVIGALLLAGVAIIPALIVAAVMLVVAAIVVFWDKIVQAAVWVAAAFLWMLSLWNKWWTFVGEKIMQFATWIWEQFFVKGFEKVVNFGKWIWDFFLDGLSFISDLGAKIWNFIKDSLGSIGGGIGSAARSVGSFLNPFDDFIQRPGQAPIGFSPSDTIVGMKDISSLGGATTVNVNNPVVRDESDIRKITDAISRELQKRGNRGFSPA